jgi:hypothetical protein
LPRTRIWCSGACGARSLNDDDFLSWHDRTGGVPPVGEDDPVLVTRTNLSDANNLYTEQYPDRNNYYNNAIVEAFDQGALDQFGERIGDSIPGKPFASATPAQTAAQLILQRSQYVRNTPHKFKLGWRYVRLEPMDVVLITDPLCGLVAQAVRILSVEEDEDGGLTIEGEEVTAQAPACCGGTPPPPLPPPTAPLGFAGIVGTGRGDPAWSANATSVIPSRPPYITIESTTLGPTELLVAIVRNRGATAVASISDDQGVGLNWVRRSQFTGTTQPGGLTAALEVWWADVRSVAVGTQLTVRANFAGTAYLPAIAVFGLVGGIDFTTVWDPNPSLPAKITGNAPAPAVSGISTSSSNSIVFAWFVTPQDLALGSSNNGGSNGFWWNEGAGFLNASSGGPLDWLWYDQLEIINTPPLTNLSGQPFDGGAQVNPTSLGYLFLVDAIAGTGPATGPVIP